MIFYRISCRSAALALLKADCRIGDSFDKDRANFLQKSYLSNGNRVVVRFVSTDHPSAELQMQREMEKTAIGFRIVWTEVNSLVASVGDVQQEEECHGFTCRGKFLGTTKRGNTRWRAARGFALVELLVFQNSTHSYLLLKECMRQR